MIYDCDSPVPKTIQKTVNANVEIKLIDLVRWSIGNDRDLLYQTTDTAQIGLLEVHSILFLDVWTCNDR